MATELTGLLNSSLKDGGVSRRTNQINSALFTSESMVR